MELNSFWWPTKEFTPLSIDVEPRRSPSRFADNRTIPHLCRKPRTRGGSFRGRCCPRFGPSPTRKCCRGRRIGSTRRTQKSRFFPEHTIKKSYLSQSESHEAFSSSNGVAQTLSNLWMASATVYLVLPRAHLCIFLTPRSDWRNRWSRLSDNNSGVWRTLEKENGMPSMRRGGRGFIRLRETHVSKNSKS